MKHTPGPWVIDTGMVRMSDQASILIADEGTTREWIAIGIEDKEGFAEVVALAHPLNAHLIASAPDLLEALKAAKEHLEYCGYGDNWERECAEIEGLSAKIENAIAKAERKG